MCASAGLAARFKPRGFEFVLAGFSLTRGVGAWSGTLREVNQVVLGAYEVVRISSQGFSGYGPSGWVLKTVHLQPGGLNKFICG